LHVRKNTPNNQLTRQALAETRELLKRRLQDLQHPVAGQRVVRELWEREDLFWGPYVDRAPHILGLESPGYLFWNWSPTEDGRTFPSWDDPVFGHLFSGFHRMNGVLIMAGANIRPGANNFPAHIMDIAPTVLYLLSEPAPEIMDGKILKEPIASTYIAEHPVDVHWTRTSRPRSLEQLSDTTRAVNRYIEEQLRAIGYVQ
jgi:predicted AlkP superfamily phosphohydrolase/phosphomutase